MVSAGATLSAREKRGWVVSGSGAWGGVCQVTLVKNLILLPPLLGEGQGDATQSDMKVSGPMRVGVLQVAHVSPFK